MLGVYILYSKAIDRYYVGRSKDIDNRLRLHQKGVFRNSFTKQSDDWQLFLTIPCDSIQQSISIEDHIKRMKSQKYIQNLKEYPDIILKLKKKYQ